MQNLEVDFLVSWLGANRAEKKLVESKGVDLALFVSNDIEAHFVTSFLSKYHILPSLKTFSRRFKKTFKKPDESVLFYLDRLKERQVYNQLRTILNTAVKQMSKNQDGVVYETLDYLGKEVSSVVTSGDLSGVDFVKDLHSRVSTYSEQRDDISFWDTPYPTLNKLIAGFRPENLITLCGRPSVGKTWCALNLVFHCWTSGAKVLIISKEMSSEEISMRLDALVFELDWYRFTRNLLTKKELKLYKRAAKERNKKLHGTLIVEADENLDGSGVMDVRASIIKHQPDVVLVDGAYLLKTENTDLVKSAVERSRLIKRLARERKVVLIQTEQMGRRAEKDGASLATVQWSDSIGQDSDFVFNITHAKDLSTRTFSVLKGRNSACGEFYINFNFDPVGFSEKLSGLCDIEKE